MKNERSKIWCLVIEKNTSSRVIEIDYLIERLRIASLNYYFILHDKDTDEDGMLKRPHYHVVIELAEVVGKQRLLTALARILAIDKNAISCCTTINLVYEFRYFLHLDNEEKYQYSIDYVQTNNMALYERLIKNQRYYNETILYQIAKNCNSKLQFIKNIGMNYYEKHYRVCDIVWEYACNNN